MSACVDDPTMADAAMPARAGDARRAPRPAACIAAIVAACAGTLTVWAIAGAGFATGALAVALALASAALAGATHREAAFAVFGDRRPFLVAAAAPVFQPPAPAAFDERRNDAGDAMDADVAWRDDATASTACPVLHGGVASLPTLSARFPARCCWKRRLKNAADRLTGACLLFATAPLLLALALAIRLGGTGPVLFRQVREGLDGRPFVILKFRTMRPQVDPNGGSQTTRNDSRVTRLGRVLRATSLDELPQLVNVLRGEMSLIGPRPHPREMRTENRLSVEIEPRYPARHRVKPGMTGWAQVNGSRGGLADAAALRERVRLDLDYVDNWSLWLDLRIALLTPIRLLFHGGGAF